MIRIPQVDPDAPAIVINVGNSNITTATWFDEQVKTPLTSPSGSEAEFLKSFEAHLSGLPQKSPPPIVIASVVPRVLAWIRNHVSQRFDRDVLVIGEKIPFPIDLDVEDPSAIGVDRVCAAAAAFDKLKTACAIVDFGTAVTVNLVSDEGVLLGGAIFPGPRLQLAALHEHTAQLPSVPVVVPEALVGRNTAAAMQNGVCRGVAGAVRNLVESYATALNRWPQVVATGGDLEMMLPLCDFIDTPVAHLTLRGIGIAYQKYLNARMGT